jgi:DNA-binding NarL/FixJ family response regulator
MRRKKLTPSQVRVLAAAADGSTLEAVAKTLGYSRTYVASRLSEVYRRYEISHLPRSDRRAEAVHRATEDGLLPRKDRNP